ncbi:MAG: glycoside hydrolase family 97 protein [Bacteroidota bacterium]
MTKIIKLSNLCYLAAFLGIFGCSAPTETETAKLSVTSPDGKIKVEFFNLDEAFGYFVSYDNKTIIDSSYLGFDFRESADITGNLKVVGTNTEEVNEDWDMPWGEVKTVNNHYKGLLVQLQEKGEQERLLNIHFKAYNDGIGFRYEFPEQPNLNDVVIMDENTQFNLTGDHNCWWIPGDWDIYEHLYNNTKFSEIDALSKRDHPNLAQTTIPENAVNTPVTMKTEEGVYLSFHEANLTNYSGMTLKVDKENMMMQSELVGSPDESKASVTVPFNTPWRTIQITDRATKLIDSKLIVNLNEPNKLGDVAWFKPMKYMGIWWEMHLDKSSWDVAAGKHGATTENAKKFIDFASQHDIGGLLVEGWNTGWERWIDFPDREGVFDFVTPYPDYDLAEVVRYGNEKGVELIMHHETSAAPRTYDQQLDTAYALMQSLGIHSVKTGYVGKIIPDGQYHHGQWMVNHYRKVLETAVKYDVAINAHEPIKATGLRRTYPNAISREGLRGQEFNAWAADGGNPPDHLPTVAFTRMLAGPIDYTPGIFNIKLDPYKPNNQVNTTLAQQLALFVVIYSPIQMAADLIEHYEGNPAFQFIVDVGVDWQDSKVINGEVGEFVTIARKERDSEKWFLGSITDEEARSFGVSLDFLDRDKQYVATIYADATDAHWDDNPTAVEINQYLVGNQTTLNVKLAPGGGQAISLIPASEEEISKLEEYPGQ